jgi:hypothetical protein
MIDLSTFMVDYTFNFFTIYFVNVRIHTKRDLGFKIFIYFFSSYDFNKTFYKYFYSDKPLLDSFFIFIEVNFGKL